MSKIKVRADLKLKSFYVADGYFVLDMERKVLKSHILYLSQFYTTIFGSMIDWYQQVKVTLDWSSLSLLGIWFEFQSEQFLRFFEVYLSTSLAKIEKFNKIKLYFNFNLVPIRFHHKKVFSRFGPPNISNIFYNFLLLR